jgi:tetratricopeptide (TPR) repeat protein
MPKDPAKTERTLVKFVKLWETLAGEHPAVIAFQNDLAAAHASLATWQSAAGRAYGSSDLAKAGIDSSQKAIEIWDRLSQSHPEVPEYRESLVMVLHELAYWMDATGRHAEAQALADRDLALCEQLAAQYPNVPQYRVRFELALGARGLSLEKVGKTRQAADAFRREFDLDKALFTEFPTVVDYALHAATAALSFLRCSHASGVDAAKWSRQELAPILTNLKRVAANPPEDPDFRRALAQGLTKLGNGLNSAGEAAAAASAFHESILLYRRVVQERPNDLQSREALGHTLRFLAFDLGPAPEHRGEVELAFRDAIDAFQGLTIRAPRKLLYWHFLADSQRNLALVLAEAQHAEQAEQEFRRAIETHERAVDKLHVEPFDEGFAASYLDLARFLQSKGRSQAAEEIVGRFISRIEALRGAFPKNAAHRERLARVHYEVANSLRDAQRRDDAESHYRQALVAYDALVAASGTKPEYQLKRAQCHRDFALLLTWAGRPADAEREYRQAIALLKKLVADVPGTGEYRFYLAHSCCGLADLLSNNKRTQEAEDLCRQALALFEKLAAENPSQDNLRVDAGHVLWQLANLAAAAGRPKEVEQDHRLALAIFEKLAADSPQNRYCRLEQGQSDWNIAALMRQQNRLPEAEKSYHDAADVYAKMLADVPGDGGPRIRFAQIEFDLAEVLRAENRLDEAEKHYRLAEAAWRKLAADNPTDPVYRIRAIGTRANQLSPLLTAKGRAREAEENYREAVGLLASLPASELVTDDRRDLTDTCYGNLIRLLKSSNRPQEATAVFREWVDLCRTSFTKSLERNPKSAEAQNSFGEALARVGCWDEAAAALDKAAELDPANHWYPFRAAPLHLRAGDVTGYRRVCRAMLEQFHGTQALEIADRTAKTCLLAPAAVPDLDRVQKLADSVVTGTEKQGNYRWFTFVKGLAEYRAGRFAESVKWLERLGPDARGDQIDASGFAVRAMAQHRLGQKEKARTALHSGQVIVAEKMPTRPPASHSTACGRIGCTARSSSAKRKPC